MITITIGRQAEVAVANFLKLSGFKILATNWRTKACEIDLVARKQEIIYFIEVKYRANNAQGGGFEYIGPQKLNRLIFAAKIWNQTNSWSGDYRILGSEVTGDN